MRIVVDTNVIISGVFFGGVPRRILEFWRDKAFELICSPEILEEYEDVLNRLEKKSKATKSQLASQFMKLLVENSVVVQPTHDKKYSRDSDDDKFINCALTGKALYIVSGDNDLLDIKEVEGIEIITARTFLDRLSI